MFQSVQNADVSVSTREHVEELKPRVGFINRWALENLHEYPNSRGTAWTATLCLDGLPVGLVENMGDGGSSWPMFNSSAIEDVWFSDIHVAFPDAHQERFIGLLTAGYGGVRISVTRRGDESAT